MSEAEVLQQRAQRLARRPVSSDARPRAAFVTFRRHEGRHAVELAFVRRVVGLDDAAVLPREARPLVGVASLDGHVVPVVDVAREGRSPTSPDQLAWGVAVEVDGRQLLLLADEVIGLVEVAPGDTAADSPASEDVVPSGITPDGASVVDVPGLVTTIRGARDDRTGTTAAQSRRRTS